jgi:hypothetical protein
MKFSDVEIVARVEVIQSLNYCALPTLATKQLQPLPGYFFPNFSPATQKPGVKTRTVQEVLPVKIRLTTLV